MTLQERYQFMPTIQALAGPVLTSQTKPNCTKSPDCTNCTQQLLQITPQSAGRHRTGNTCDRDGTSEGGALELLAIAILN